MIAFLDSGYGGKTIMQAVEQLLPDYDYLYLGDNLRAPYGNYSPEKIIEYSDKAIEFLFNQGAVLIIIACNTICAPALRLLQEKYLRTPNVKDRKILGVIRPVVESAVDSADKRIGVIGTTATISSKAYETEIHKLDPGIKVIGQACPLLALLVEENWHNKPEARMILKKYLRPLKSNNIDSLILGCTHYPFMLPAIKRIMGKSIDVVNPGPIVAASLKEYLHRHPEIESLLSKKGKRRYLTSGSPEEFQAKVKSMLGIHCHQVEKVSF